MITNEQTTHSYLVKILESFIVKYHPDPFLMSSIKSTSALKESCEKRTKKNNPPSDTLSLLKIINMWWTMHSRSYSVIVIITVLLYPLSFSCALLIWLQLVIFYISQSAFQQPPEKRPDKLNGTSCFIQQWVTDLYIYVGVEKMAKNISGFFFSQKTLCTFIRTQNVLSLHCILAF